MSAPDTSALSQPQAPAPMPAPEPTDQSPAAPGTTPSPAPAGPTPSVPVWRQIVMGALEGAAGATGQKHFGGGLAGGAQNYLAQQQQQKENAIQQAQVETQKAKAQSDISFQSAQAANSVAEAAKNNAIAANMPQEAKDAHEKSAIALMGQMQDLGISPSVIADDTNEGAHGALQALNQAGAAQGGVPHIFNIEVGGQHLAYDLSQLSGTPQGLAIVNQTRQMQGQDPVTAAQWKGTPKAAQAQASENALNFLNPPPSKNSGEATGKLAQYQSVLNAYKAKPNADPEQLKKLQGVVDNLSSAKDALQANDKAVAGMKTQQALALNAGKIDQTNAQTPQWLPKVGADEKKKAELAENIAENANGVATILKNRPDLFGAAAGRFTNIEQLTGNNDPDISKLGTLIHNVAMANSGVHGFRSNEGVKDTEKSLLNNFHNGPQAVANALVGLTRSTQTFIDNARPEGYKTHSRMGGALKGMSQ